MGLSGSQRGSSSECFLLWLSLKLSAPSHSQRLRRSALQPRQTHSIRLARLGWSNNSRRPLAGGSQVFCHLILLPRRRITAGVCPIQSGRPQVAPLPPGRPRRLSHGPLALHIPPPSQDPGDPGCTTAGPLPWRRGDGVGSLWCSGDSMKADGGGWDGVEEDEEDGGIEGATWKEIF